MRRVRYSVAMSLDGYIAGPNGESDWIIMDPEIDFASLPAEFDTVLLGRKTYDAMRRQHPGTGMPDMQTYVFSHTLRQGDCPGATVLDAPTAAVAAIKATRGKDLWLFGGGALFRSFLDLGLVDMVEVAVMPVLLGSAVPLLPQPAGRWPLTLRRHHGYGQTGTVSLVCAVTPGSG